jgi:hypothetical protein
MPNGSTSRPDSPEIILRESACTAATDLAELSDSLPGDPARSARIADRLSEELAELGQMLRALPGRPCAMSGHDAQLLSALRTAHASGNDVAETIARGLARLGATWQVLVNRPGSWEASHVAELLQGTVGDDDALDMYRTTS